MPLDQPTVITAVNGLPTSPFNGTGTVGIVITSGIPSYFQLIGQNLDRIVSVRWYPVNPASLLWEDRQLILVSPLLGTFMIRVLDNYLNDCNRGGQISFRLDDGTTLQYPTETYGRVSLGPLWQAPAQGLITG